MSKWEGGRGKVQNKLSSPANWHWCCGIIPHAYTYQASSHSQCVLAWLQVFGQCPTRLIVAGSRKRASCKWPSDQSSESAILIHHASTSKWLGKQSFQTVNLPLHDIRMPLMSENVPFLPTMREKVNGLLSKLLLFKIAWPAVSLLAVICFPAFLQSICL